MYKSTPYPGELARALRRQMANLPAPGVLRAETGARIYTPVSVILSRVLDHEKSFGTCAYIRATADRVASDNQIGQGMLSVLDVHMTNQTKTQAAVAAALGATLTATGELMEDIKAFFGGDLECGTATNTEKDTHGNMNLSDLVDDISLNEGALQDLWNAGASALSLQTNLATSLLTSADNLLCNAATIGCMYDNIGEDQGAEGGPFDEDGTVDMALFDTQDTLSVMENTLSGMFSDTLGMANALAGAGDVLANRDSACSNSDTATYVQDMASSLETEGVSLLDGA